jgi:hypothetical protein
VPHSVTRLVALLALGAAAVVAGLIATGRAPSVGSGDSTESAQSAEPQLLDKAFASNARSGKLAMDARVAVQGPGAAQFGGGNATVRMTGAFDAGRKSGPAVALDGRVEAAGQAFGFGVTAVRGRAFVGVNGTNYELPQAQAQQMFGQLSRSQANDEAIALLGIDPRDWFKDVREEGTATIDGVATRRVTADVDTDKMVDDFFEIAARSPAASAPQLSADQRDELKSAFKNVRAEVYTGQKDGILRRMALTAEIKASDGSGRFEFDMRVSDVNKRQRIAPPGSAKPFSQLQTDLNSGLLSGLAGGGTRPSPPPASAPSAPPPSDTGTPAVPGEAQPYLACVRRAGSTAELQRCAALLK